MDISVFFTSDLTSSERRISPQWTLAYLKQRLEQITGVQPQFQTLQYHPHNSSSEYVVLQAEDDEKVTVAELGVAPFSRIHVQDSNPDSLLQDFVDLDGTGAGFQLSEEEYQKRADSVFQWKKNQQLGRFDPKYNERVRKLEIDAAASAQTIKVGSRCRIIGISGERRGQVKYVGKIENLDGGKQMWVGVEFDEPVGKNDGSLDGVRYFTAKAGYGSFVSPKKVEVGDFPEQDFTNSDDNEI